MPWLVTSTVAKSVKIRRLLYKRICFTFFWNQISKIKSHMRRMLQLKHSIQLNQNSSAQFSKYRNVKNFRHSRLLHTWFFIYGRELWLTTTYINVQMKYNFIPVLTFLLLLLWILLTLSNLFLILLENPDMTSQHSCPQELESLNLHQTHLP